MKKAGKITTLAAGIGLVATTTLFATEKGKEIIATVSDRFSAPKTEQGINESKHFTTQTLEIPGTFTTEKLDNYVELPKQELVENNNGVFTIRDKNGKIVAKENIDGGDDFGDTIKKFVNDNRAFINRIKTTKGCSNLANVFLTLEKDANTGLCADDVSTRFNAAFENDNPYGDYLDLYIKAYGLFTANFKTTNVDFVNPKPAIASNTTTKKVEETKPETTTNKPKRRRLTDVASDDVANELAAKKALLKDISLSKERQEQLKKEIAILEAQVAANN